MKASLVGLLMLLGLAGTACSEASGDEQGGAVDRTAAQVEISRSVLAALRNAAHDYGQDHLGHYIKLRKPDLLQTSDPDIPDGVSVELWASHTGYCIKVTNRTLPSIHPWRVATAGDGSSQIASADRCR